MTNLSLPSSVELISVHVPKTSGSTFGKIILPQTHPLSQILYDYDNLPINILIQKGQLTTQIRVIHGHFPADKYRKYYPKAKRVTWVRNPILLLISAYYFWLSFTDYFFDDNHRYVVENKVAFSDFVKQPFTHNLISNYFAKRMKLTDFYFVGMQEFFRDDLNDLKKILGWPTLQVTISNRNSYENYQDKVMDILTNQSLVKNIVSLNSPDRDIYQAAVSLRSQRKGLSSLIKMYELSLKESQSRLRYNSFKEPQLNKCSGLGSKQGVNPP